jgi:bifunctional DNA-binding transcriptional regulator/antitoxin component of YhaV-PrlF toxin-antitoxin module
MDKKSTNEIVVPWSVLRRGGFKGGDKVEIEAHGGAIVLRKVPAPPKHTKTLTPAEAKIVRRGEAQLKRGESKPWRVVKRALSL